MYELLMWERAHAGVAAALLPGYVVQGLRPSLPLWTPEPYRSLAQDCWQGQPSWRPTFDRIIELVEAMMASADDLEPSEPHPHYFQSDKLVGLGMRSRLKTNASDLTAMAGSLLGIGDISVDAGGPAQLHDNSAGMPGAADDSVLGMFGSIMGTSAHQKVDEMIADMNA